jgi:hypothetical protein
MKQQDSETPSRHIFLSYSRKDIWEMRAVYNEVRLAGFRVWMDEQLSPGTPDWKQTLEKKMDAASCVLCICSPAARHSKWVNIEIKLAQQREVSIYPVLVKGGARNSIPTVLSSMQFSDCQTNYETALGKLVDELMKYHRDALIFDMKAVFGASGVKWTYIASLFWFASEVRKTRLFLSFERPTGERVRDSLTQLLHHARRLNVDHFTLRDITNVLSSVRRVGFDRLTNQDRKALENKLRLVQDKVAGLAEHADPSFKPGRRPGNPVSVTRKGPEPSPRSRLSTPG